jgi:polymorphic toxin system nucleotidyltransferase-like protein
VTPTADPILEAVCDELRARHGCHTAILYGSRARGDARPDSDYDVAGFGSTPASFRDARRWRGRWLDVFVYPERHLARPGRELLKLRDGVVLFEKGGAGTRLLRRLDRTFRKGPERLAPDEARARRVWAWKMLDRAAHPDPEAGYRRAWLLTALLEDYFHLRGLWFLGPGRSLAWLRAHDPASHAVFAEALRPDAELDAVRRLVEAVAGPEAAEDA